MSIPKIAIVPSNATETGTIRSSLGRTNFAAAVAF
jgi:hypothetical protein